MQYALPTIQEEQTPIEPTQQPNYIYLIHQ